MTDVVRFTGKDCEADEFRPIDGGALGYWPVLAEEGGTVEDERFKYLDPRRYGLQPGLSTTQHEVFNNALLAQTALIAAGKIDADSKVTVPAGYTIRIAPDFLNGNSIRMEDNTSLEVPAGARLKALPNANLPGTGVNDSAVVHAYKKVNVSVFGDGIIEGERDVHTDPAQYIPGMAGEGGHCVQYFSVKRGRIAWLKLTQGWGDGLMIGFDQHDDPRDTGDVTAEGTCTNGAGVCEDIVVAGITCDLNRRQGISIVGGKRIHLDEVTCRRTGGTAPGAGIDVEASAGWKNGDSGTGILILAPIEGCTGTNMLMEDNVYGIVNTSGARAAQFSNVIFRRNSTHHYWSSGAGGTETHDQSLSHFVMISDEDGTNAPIPSPLPTAIMMSNSDGHHEVAHGTIRGTFKIGVDIAGSGVGNGNKTMRDVRVFADASCERAFRIWNTAHESKLFDCEAHGAQVNLELGGSQRLTVKGFESFDAAGDPGSPFTAGVVIDTAHHSTLDIKSFRAAHVGISLAQTAHAKVALEAHFSGSQGINLYDVQNCNLDLHATDNSVSAPASFPNVTVVGASSDNRIKIFARPGSGVGNPRYAVTVALGCERNDLRGSDISGHSPRNFSFDDPTTRFDTSEDVDTHGDANAIITPHLAGVHRWTTVLTGPRDARLGTTDAFKGWKPRVIHAVNSPYALNIKTPVGGSAIVADNGLLYYPLSAQVGQYASTPAASMDAPIPNANSTVRVTALINPATWAGNPVQQHIASQDDGNAAGQRGWSFLLAYGALLAFNWSLGGTALDKNLASSIAIPGVADGTPMWVRVELTQVGGDVQGKFYWSAFVPGSTTEPIDANFTQFGTTQTASSTTLGAMHTSTYPFEVGGVVSGGVQGFDGEIYALSAKVGATMAVDFNPERDTTAGVSTWTSSTSEVWTLHGTSGEYTTIKSLPSGGASQAQLRWTGSALILESYGSL